jgi:hypothetical protein
LAPVTEHLVDLLVCGMRVAPAQRRAGHPLAELIHVQRQPKPAGNLRVSHKLIMPRTGYVQRALSSRCRPLPGYRPRADLAPPRPTLRLLREDLTVSWESPRRFRLLADRSDPFSSVGHQLDV